jgi:type VI secretion system protein ImpF
MISIQHTLLHAEEAGKYNSLHDIAHHIEGLLNHITAKLPHSPSDSVLSSVLNYGLPSVVGLRMDNQTLSRVLTDVRVALSRFEPRLDPQSIQVQLRKDSQSSPHIFCIDVNAKVLPSPRKTHAPHELFLRLNFNIHFGLINVVNLANPSH